MSDVVLIKGNVTHSITLDPSVWIFDDRKKRMDEFFLTTAFEDEALAYQKKIAKQWDKEINEGSQPPKKNEELFVHKKDISGDWGVPFAPFLANAKPTETATAVLCHLASGGKISLNLQQAADSILCFALDGKPIRETGPIHLIYADGSNRENPVKEIVLFEVI